VLHLLISLTDDYLVTKFTSPKYEVYYSIYNRLFSLAGTLFTLALTPVWSAVTKAQEERDYLWVRKIYKFANRAVLLGVAGEFLIILVMQFVVNIWLGSHAIQVDYTYALIFAVYGSIMLFQSVQETFAYGFGKVMVLCVCYSIGVIVKYSLVYFGTMLYPDAWIIVVLSNILVILPFCIVQPFYLKKEIERLRN
jgi:putative O-antigen export protein